MWILGIITSPVSFRVSLKPSNQEVIEATDDLQYEITDMEVLADVFSFCSIRVSHLHGPPFVIHPEDRKALSSLGVTTIVLPTLPREMNSWAARLIATASCRKEHDNPSAASNR